MKKLLFTLIITLLSVSCGSRDTGGPTEIESDSFSSIEIRKGDLVFYDFSNGKPGAELARIPFSEKIKLQLPKYSGPLMVRLEQASLVDIITKDTIELTVGVLPWELVINYKGNTGTINGLYQSGDPFPVNPITTIASTYVKYLISTGFKVDRAIDKVSSDFEKLFGFDITRTPQSNLSVNAGVSDVTDQYALLLAGFSQLAADFSLSANSVRGFSIQQLMKYFILDIELDGLLDGKRVGTPEFKVGNKILGPLSFRDDLINASMAVLFNTKVQKSQLSPEDLSPWVQHVLTENVDFLVPVNRSFVADETPPVLNWETPLENGSFYDAMEVKAVAIESNSWVSDIRAMVDGVFVANTSNEQGHFEGSIDTEQFKNGPVEVTVWAMNASGFTSVQKRMVIISNEFARININEMTSCAIVQNCIRDLQNGDSVLTNASISASVLPDSNVQVTSFRVTIDGKELVDQASHDPLNYFHILDPLIDIIPEGPFELVAAVTDNTGKVVTEKRILHLNDITFNQHQSHIRSSATVNDNAFRWGSLSKAGDMDMDSWADLLVVDESAYIRKGSSTSPLSTEWKIADGNWVSAVGDCDFNKDGNPDLALGNPYDGSGGTVKIFLGPMTGSKNFTNGTAELHGFNSGTRKERIGRSLVCAEMDEFPGSELVVISDEVVNERTWEWLRIYSWKNGSWKTYDSSDLAGLAQNGVGGIQIDSLSKVAGPADVNGDGFEDVFITGVRGLDTSKRYSFLIYGQKQGQFYTSPNVDESAVLLTSNQPDSTGLPASWPVRPFVLGDLNQDGFDEVGLSRLEYCIDGIECVGGLTTGERPSLEIIYGGTDFPNSALNQRIYHPFFNPPFDTNTRFGESVVSADFNGDSFDDLAIGVPNAAGQNGETVLLYGPDFGKFEIFDPSIFDQSRYGSFASSMDLNNDSRSDLILSAWGDVGSSNVGKIEFLFDTL